MKKIRHSMFCVTCVYLRNITHTVLSVLLLNVSLLNVCASCYTIISKQHGKGSVQFVITSSCTGVSKFDLFQGSENWPTAGACVWNWCWVWRKGWCECSLCFLFGLLGLCVCVRVCVCMIHLHFLSHSHHLSQSLFFIFLFSLFFKMTIFCSLPPWPGLKYTGEFCKVKVCWRRIRFKIPVALFLCTSLKTTFLLRISYF